jgi:hypothetical protein
MFECRSVTALEASADIHLNMSPELSYDESANRAISNMSGGNRLCISLLALAEYSRPEPWLDLRSTVSLLYMPNAISARLPRLS